MIVLICGDRNWDNKVSIMSAVKHLMKEHSELIIVEGEALGADSLARDVGTELGLEVRKYPANWDMLKKAAGPIRNQQMLDSENIDLVLAFHSNISQSKGTRDMVIRAARAKIPYKIYDK